MALTVYSKTGADSAINAAVSAQVGSGSGGSAVTSVSGRVGAVTLTKNDVNLANVDNTADASKPISTAVQTALNLKAPLASPAFTGTPTAPTPTTSDSSTKIATTAWVKAQNYGTGSGGGTGGATTPGTGRNGLTGWYHADGNGVLPGNSAAANSTALQALVNSIPTAFGGTVLGGKVVFPEGRYHFASQVTIPAGVKLMGSGGSRVGTEGWWDSAGTSFIADTAGMTLLVLNADASGATLSQLGPSIESINFFGQSLGFSARAIYCINVNRWTIRDCGFKWLSTGLEADSTQNSGGDCSWWMVDNCTWVECATGFKVTSGSGAVMGGDAVGCTIAFDIYGYSAPMKMWGTKFDVGDGQTGIRARSYNSMYTNLYFELPGTGTGILVAPDPAVGFSGNDNSFMGCGFLGHVAGSIAMKISSGSNRTRIIAPFFGTNTGNQLQDSGTGTIILGSNSASSLMTEN